MSVSEDSNTRPPLNRSREKIRTCISKIAPGCKKEFLSIHPGVRICSKCREAMRQYSGSAC
jgi:hypothetical protein